MTTYRQSGVSIDEGRRLVGKIKKIVSSGRSSSPIGGFSALYPLPGKDLFLSGCCDGVGTKLKIAFLLNKHDTVGIDLVAMSVNDLICTGAKPLFFLDYFACGRLDVRTAERVIRGIQKACEEARCQLLGGETAEMPGFYKKGEYDLAGFALGMVRPRDAINGKKIKEGDIVVGLQSSGLHSNGYSLVRKIFSKSELVKMGKELLVPTRIYVKQILSLLAGCNSSRAAVVKGIAHLTGGGWIENIPRILPPGLQATVKKSSWTVQEIFHKIQKRAGSSDLEMFKTFNMGIGLVLVVDPGGLTSVMRSLKDAVILGKVTRGRNGVVFI